MTRIAKLTESKASLELQSFLIAKKWWVRKLHGNIYQMGLPDLMLVRKKDGKIILVELKILLPKRIGSTKPFTQFTLISKLQGSQVGTILMISRLRAPMYIIGFSKEGWFIAGNPLSQDEPIYPMSIEELYDILNK